MAYVAKYVHGSFIKMNDIRREFHNSFIYAGGCIGLFTKKIHV